MGLSRCHWSNHEWYRKIYTYQELVKSPTPHPRPPTPTTPTPTKKSKKKKRETTQSIYVPILWDTMCMGHGFVQQYPSAMKWSMGNNNFCILETELCPLPLTYQIVVVYQCDIIEFSQGIVHIMQCPSIMPGTMPGCVTSHLYVEPTEGTCVSSNSPACSSCTWRGSQIYMEGQQICTERGCKIYKKGQQYIHRGAAIYK